MVASKEYSSIVGPDPELVYGFFDPNDSNPVSIITRNGRRESIGLNLAALLTSGGLIESSATEDGAQVAALANAAVGAEAGYAVARGQHTTVDADDTVVTGLATVVAVVASLDDDPVAGCQWVTAGIGDQDGAPAAGSVFIKTWKATASDDTAPTAATTFGKKVNWIAVGTPAEA